MLSRSGQYPLHIRFKHVAESLKTSELLPNDHIHDLLKALSEALSHYSRLETIRLDIPSYLFEEFAAKHVQAAPMLRWLHLSSDGCDLPFDFLGGSAPLLTDLTLYGCGPAYNSHLLRNLTSLKLLGGAETTFEDRLCEALRLMPALESLDLQEVYCNPPEDDTVVASLPRLRELKLKCSAVTCNALFDYVSFPASTSVHVAIKDCNLPDDTNIEDLVEFWTSIGRVLSPDFYPGRQRIIKSLAAYGDDEYEGKYFMLKAWNVSLSSDFNFTASSWRRTRPQPSPNFIVNIDWTHPEGQDPKFFENNYEAAFNALFLPGLEIMYTGHFPRDPHRRSNLLTDALSPHLWLSPLRTIILFVECCMHYLPELLVYRPGGRPLPLPTLERIILKAADLHPYLVDDLYSSFRIRSRKGLKLQKLVMSGCEDCADVCKLCRVVDEVDLNSESLTETCTEFSESEEDEESGDSETGTEE
ncbi:hypothetical protein VNI00_017216 [Paramarasmius palmivorus]|uniref:F-box protein n=1 Tax=Paramarasmius palmivorus TaxID=297713 RepID=A0AAW0BAJ1_9AGAR